MLRRWLLRFWSSISSSIWSSISSSIVARLRPPKIAALPAARPANDTGLEMTELEMAVEVEIDLTDLLPAIERARATPDASGVRLAAAPCPDDVVAARGLPVLFDDEDDMEAPNPSQRATPACAPRLELFEVEEDPRRASLRPTRRVRLARIAAALSKVGNG